MKGEYQCPYCQYMSLRKWNLKTHVRNVHGIKDFSNKSNEKPNINQQNIRPTEYVQFNFPNGSNEKPQIYQQKNSIPNLNVKINQKIKFSDACVNLHNHVMQKYNNNLLFKWARMTNMKSV